MIRFGLRQTAFVTVAVVVAACGGGGTTEDTRVYTSKFSEGSGWLTYRAGAHVECEPLPIQTDASGVSYATSGAPWWIDPNHAPPGLGYLHLVAFAYHHDWSVDGVITGASAGRPLDLRNATLSLRWRAPALRMPEGARLLMWFQTRLRTSTSDRPRYANYVLRAQPLVAIPDDSTWLETTLRLTTEPRQYECLGSNADRTETYGCANSVDEVLRDWNADLGFVILFPDESMSEHILGNVEFERIVIDVPSTNLLTHSSETPTLTRGPSTCHS